MNAGDAGSTPGVERDHCLDSLESSSASSAAAGILRALTGELESAVDECGQVVEQNNTWLAETIQKNTKNLQYQTCARGPLG